MKSELEIFIQKIKECQKSKDKDSCLGCKDFFVCKLRISYIDKMFSLMHKGKR